MPLLAIKVSQIECALAACPAGSRRARYGALNRFLRWSFRREDPALAPPTALLDPHERPKPLPPRERVLVAAELAAIQRAIEDLPNAATRDLLLFMLTTPCRESEAAMMRFRDIDLSAARWTQPVSKNGLPHVFPLNERALAILRRRRLDWTNGTSSLNALVFPGHRGGDVFVGWSSAKVAIDKRLANHGAIAAPWRLHDIRRSFATQMGEQGFDDGLIDLTLNHAGARTRSRLTGTYNRSEKLAARAEPLAVRSVFLDRAMGIPQ